MTQDLNTNEQLLRPNEKPIGTFSHHYGKHLVIGPREEEADTEAYSIDRTQLDDAGKQGLAAFDLRNSEAFKTAKKNRPHDGASFDGDPSIGLEPPMPPAEIMELINQDALESGMLDSDSTPTSKRLTGSVAVGVVIVDGPEALSFSKAEITKVHAEVQHGLSFLGNQCGIKDPIQFHYDLKTISITTADDPVKKQESHWLTPTMKAMKYTNPGAYVDYLRSHYKTDWAYCVFFVKYSQQHFAYARMGGPYTCMQYSNDHWGPDNIDRIFAHESGHIFNASDEYSGSNCTCTSKYGMYQVINGNCKSCATNAVGCIMSMSTWNMCSYTPWHLGYLNLNSLFFESNAFPDVYLYMDASGVSSSNQSGGKVSCQYGKGPLVELKFDLDADKGTFGLESTTNPGVYISVYAPNVNSGNAIGGTVSCHYGLGKNESFRLAPQTNGKLAIESVAFPGVFLRLDGTNLSSSNRVGGTVNCSFGANTNEMLTVLNAGPLPYTIQTPGGTISYNSGTQSWSGEKVTGQWSPFPIQQSKTLGWVEGDTLTITCNLNTNPSVSPQPPSTAYTGLSVTALNNPTEAEIQAAITSMQSASTAKEGQLFSGITAKSTPGKSDIFYGAVASSAPSITVGGGGTLTNFNYQWTFQFNAGGNFNPQNIVIISTYGVQMVDVENP